MPTRERWIVYPLLFLTLGIALRDKVIPPPHLGNLGLQIEAGEIATSRLFCNELFIEGSNGRPVVVARADATTLAGTVETFTASGMPQVRLLSMDTGGMVTTMGQGGKVLLMMGHLGKNFGVFAQWPELGSPIPLTLPWRLEATPQSPKKPAGPAKANQKQPSPKAQNPEK